MLSYLWYLAGYGESDAPKTEDGTDKKEQDESEQSSEDQSYEEYESSSSGSE